MRIPLKELFSTSEEIHAFIVGISHGWFFWQKHPPLTKKMKKERHYYGIGKIVGMMLLVLFQVGICWLVKVIVF